MSEDKTKQSTKERPSSNTDNIEEVSVEVSGPRLDISAGEKLYHSLLDWCAKNLTDLPHTVAKSATKQDESGKAEWRVDSYPGFNVKIKFQYKGEWLQLERFATPEIACDVPPTLSRCTYEKIVLSSNRRNRNLIYELLQECEPTAIMEGGQNTIIYGAYYDMWDRLGHPRRRRPLSSVILNEESKSKLMNDVREFLASEQWYVDRGIPYRRGYLLYGPPGCGKTSFILGIAGEIGYGICIISLNAKALDDVGLNVLVNKTPEKCIILLEDVDAAFRSREDPNSSTREQNLSYEGGSNAVTFGGLLNALDGVASSEGRLVFMTTNYVGNLDPALVRPGRVDMKVLVDYPNDEQLSQIFARFYSETSEEMKRDFVTRIKELGSNLSMAAIQGLFMCHKQDGQAAIDDIQVYFKEQLLLKGDTDNAQGLYN